MIANWKKFSMGLVMLVTFFIVLVLMFMPLFNGKNAMEYLDNLYNSISKGSAYYIPDARENIQAAKGSMATFSAALKDPDQAEKTRVLFEKAGAEATVEGNKLNVKGDLGAIFESIIQDSDAIYKNDGAAVSGRYGYEEREAMHNWAVALEAAKKDFQKQKEFKSANFVEGVISKALAPAYNYYKVEPQHIKEKMGIVVLSLVFYVFYTLWYGFGILYLFEGWGMKLEH